MGVKGGGRRWENCILDERTDNLKAVLKRVFLLVIIVARFGFIYIFCELVMCA